MNHPAYYLTIIYCRINDFIIFQKWRKEKQQLRSSNLYIERTSENYLFILFIDLKQTFDNVNRNKLKEALDELRFRRKLKYLIMVTRDRSKAQTQEKQLT